MVGAHTGRVHALKVCQNAPPPSLRRQGAGGEALRVRSCRPRIFKRPKGAVDTAWRPDSPIGMKSRSILAFAALASLTYATAARADVPPPNQAGCEMKNAGDACTTDDEKDGSCVKQTCSKLDYSNGTPPTSVDYECILCSGPPLADTEPEKESADSADSESCSFALPKAAASTMGAAAAIAAGLLLMRRRSRKAG